MFRRWIRAGLLVGAIAAGCGPSADRGEAPRFLPGWDEARAALIAGLDDWRASAPPYPASRQVGGVVFADRRRGPGDRLRSYAILGRAEVENARQFTVRLEIERQDAPRLVRYNVLGRDPVWVFRLEDYEMISHWAHPMDDEGAGAPSSSGQPGSPAPAERSR